MRRHYTSSPRSKVAVYKGRPGDVGLRSANMQEPLKEGYARCEVCGRGIRVRQDGTLQAHQTSAKRGRGVPCSGADPSHNARDRHRISELSMCDEHGEYLIPGGRSFACGCINKNYTYNRKGQS